MESELDADKVASGVQGDVASMPFTPDARNMINDLVQMRARIRRCAVLSAERGSMRHATHPKMV